MSGPTLLQRIESRVTAIPLNVATGWSVAVIATTSARFSAVRSAGAGSTISLSDALKLGMRLNRNIAWVGAVAVAVSTTALLIVVVSFLVSPRWGMIIRLVWLTLTTAIAASCWYVAKGSPGPATWLMTLGALSGGTAELTRIRGGRRS